ncbi:MAG TPA: zf-HC2 domain-containing protein [Thermoanaerobaculia bacterium]|nr:zf-HC2 domain-containing protein [Thermoanaerobaculia bacterium]
MSHPEPDVLAAYHAGELTEPEERRLQDHLVGCPECAALLLDLDGLSDSGFGAGSLAPADQEALWKSLQSEIRKEEAPVPLAPVVSLRRRAASARWLQALAAALLAVSIGLSLWVAELKHRVNELLQPQANAPVLDLDADAARGEGGGGAVVVSPGNHFFTLILTPAGERRYERYRVEIAPGGGKEAWSYEGALNSSGSLSVTVPLPALGSGRFQVRLFGLGPGSAGGKELIEEHALRIDDR